jgi:hypothetical protein
LFLRSLDQLGVAEAKTGTPKTRHRFDIWAACVIEYAYTFAARDNLQTGFA